MPPIAKELRLLYDLCRLKEDMLPFLRRSRLLCDVRRCRPGEGEGDPVFVMPADLVGVLKFHTERLCRSMPGGRLECDISIAIIRL